VETRPLLTEPWRTGGMAGETPAPPMPREFLYPL